MEEKSCEARDILGLFFKHVAITCVGLGGGIFKGIFAVLGGSKKLGFCIWGGGGGGGGDGGGLYQYACQYTHVANARHMESCK